MELKVLGLAFQSSEGFTTKMYVRICGLLLDTTLVQKEQLQIFFLFLDLVDIRNKSLFFLLFAEMFNFAVTGM